MPHVPPPQPPAEHTRRVERVEASLTAPGAPYAVVVTERGVPEYADGPRTLREFVETTWAHGDAPFLVDGERTCSYGQFFAAASALAVLLRERYGLRSGDRAVVATRNVPAWQIAFWAAQLAGIVAVPADALWTDEEFAHVLNDCGPEVLLVDGEWLGRAAGWARRTGTRVVLLPGPERAGEETPGLRIERYEEFPAPDPLAAPPDAEPRPEDDATILYTADGSGRLRGAVATHLALAGAATDSRYHAAVAALVRGVFPGQAPAVRLTLPFPRPAAFSALYGAMAVGAALLLAEDLAGAAEGEAHPLPGSGYGLAETGGSVLVPSDPDRGDGPGRAGRPAPATEVRIAGPSGEALPDGAAGELWLRGQSLFRGYWHDPAATGAAFGDGGWFRTGDRAVLREGWVSVLTCP
ncbi:AMP-binding protein [Streptomyces californicus]|uniref:class I adenylate-forming enzyme family protein n=1 Tax=Streptomyces TaxID=1883 RepID=UPI0006AF44B6|nr:class I adenylate-forming enzyme family protein [Streptomyces sp. NRRL F-2295]